MLKKHFAFVCELTLPSSFSSTHGYLLHDKLYNLLLKIKDKDVAKYI